MTFRLKCRACDVVTLKHLDFLSLVFILQSISKKLLIKICHSVFKYNLLIKSSQVYYEIGY